MYYLFPLNFLFSPAMGRTIERAMNADNYEAYEMDDDDSYSNMNGKTWKTTVMM